VVGDREAQDSGAAQPRRLRSARPAWVTSVTTKPVQETGWTPPVSDAPPPGIAGRKNHPHAARVGALDRDLSLQLLTLCPAEHPSEKLGATSRFRPHRGRVLFAVPDHALGSSLTRQPGCLRDILEGSERNLLGHRTPMRPRRPAMRGGFRANESGATATRGRIDGNLAITSGDGTREQRLATKRARRRECAPRTADAATPASPHPENGFRPRRP
jgi:hypothetical protein